MFRRCTWQLLPGFTEAFWPCALPGNGGCTLITFRMAHLLGIVDGAGLPIGVSRPRYVSVGVLVVALHSLMPCCPMSQLQKKSWYLAHSGFSVLVSVCPSLHACQRGNLKSVLHDCRCTAWWQEHMRRYPWSPSDTGSKARPVVHVSSCGPPWLLQFLCTAPYEATDKHGRQPVSQAPVCPTVRAGKEIRCVAGVSQARLSCDLLLSRREIADFEASNPLVGVHRCQANLCCASAHHAAWVCCERWSQMSKV